MPPAFHDVDSAQFRQLCGHFATGVVIITATAQDGAPAGMTANSFASVSLNPPLVSVNVDHAADFHPVMLQAAGYVFNVLSSAQEALSRRFASNAVQRFDGVGYKLDDRGFILLDGVVATIACVPHSRFEAGDHTVFVGRVIGGGVASGRPLLYYRGGYVTPGRV
jgi:flavin reductase (DIM6/NTAB) family NADH-FMN oxidoreductase RutF